MDFTEVTKIQDRAISEVSDHVQPGAAILVEAPTGAGKTRINSRNIGNFIEKFAAENGRMPYILALQHRGALAGQALEAYSKWCPESNVSRSFSTEGNLDQSGTINYAIVNTVAAHLNDLKAPDLVTIDEAHHASDKETAHYSLVLQKASELNPNLTLITTTATPNRPDHRDLNPKLRNAKRVTIGYKELERAGQIRLPVTKTVTIRLADGNTTNNIMRAKYRPEKDAEAAGLNKLLNDVRPSDFHAQMVDAWETSFKDQMDAKGINAGSIAYEGTIAAARAWAYEFSRRGHKVGIVDSDQDKDQNKATLKALENGEISVIVSVKMIDEGIDIPRTRCILIGNATTSETQYHQMVGRSMRMGSDPDLQAVKPIVLDGGASTMIHGAIERRAEILDFFQNLQREPRQENTPDADLMPPMKSGKYTPWRVLKDPPPVMAVTDGKQSIYAIVNKTPDGRTLYSLAEAREVKGRAQMLLLKDQSGKPLVGISADQLREVERDRLLPARHEILRMEATASLRHPGKSLVDERLAENPEYIQSAQAFASYMNRGAGR